MSPPPLVWLFPLFLLLSLPSFVSSENKSCSQPDNCWSPWSPCTVTCRERGEEGSQFVKKWRHWGCDHCPNVTQPREKAKFENCDYNVPFCVWHEHDEISKRTVTRLTVLAIATFLIAVPTLTICCRYTPGHPLLCCLRKRKSRKLFENGGSKPEEESDT